MAVDTVLQFGLYFKSHIWTKLEQSDLVTILGKSRAFSLIIPELNHFGEFGVHQPFEGMESNSTLKLWLSMPDLFLANEQDCYVVCFCADVRACFVGIVFAFFHLISASSGRKYQGEKNRFPCLTVIRPKKTVGNLS